MERIRPEAGLNNEYRTRNIEYRRKVRSKNFEGVIDEDFEILAFSILQLWCSVFDIRCSIFFFSVQN